MKTILTLVLVTSFPALSFSELPETVSTTISRLDVWEEDKRAELDLEIQKKRDEVIAVLEREMKSATKRGELEVALAIKSEIGRLRKPVSPSREGADSKKADKPKDVFVGRTYGRYGVHFTFSPEGKGIRTDNEGDQNFTWEYQTNGDIKVTVQNGRALYFRFGKSPRDAFRVEDAGKSLLEMELQ